MMVARSILVLVVALLALSACTTSQPVHKGKERPGAEKVAKEAGQATGEADTDERVLYSSSMDKADLEAGGEPEDAEAVEEADEAKIPEQVEVEVSADKTYMLGGETFTDVASLQEALVKIRAERPSDTLLIRSDAQTPQAVIVDVISAAKRVGFKNMQLRVDGDAPADEQSPAVE